MGPRRSRLAASLAVAWEYEVLAARRLEAIGERMSSEDSKAQLKVLSSFCRAHASRVHARLAGLGRGPLPVPAEIEYIWSIDLGEAILREIENTKAQAECYSRMLEVARQQVDLSTAWVCELNRSEEQDCLKELQRLWRRSAQELAQNVEYQSPLLDL